MADDGVTLRAIDWRETFPFTHLFRAFRVAVHPSKIVLALLLLGCLWCGGLVLDAIWAHNSEVTIAQLDDLTTSSGAMTPYRAAALRAIDSGLLPPGDGFISRYRAEALRQAGNPDNVRFPIFHTFFDYEVTQANDVLMFRYAGDPFEAVWRFVVVGPLWLWSQHWLFALVYTAWFLLVWSVLGGAIARIAAVHVARDEKISVRQSLAFSAGKILSFIFAPVIPVVIILVIGLLTAAASFGLLHIPYAGPIVVGLFFFLALLGGFIVTLVTLGTLGGFNLMYPTVAVEGSDSFDAISRSFSYVFARPWRMLWYTVVAVVYGAICYLFVRFFIWIMLAATWFFMNWFLNGHPAQFWPMMWPYPRDPQASLPFRPDYANLNWGEKVGAGLIVWWVYVVIGLIGAFAISFYFSANTIIYYLMRREVDATEMDDVYVEETEDEVEEGMPPAGATESIGVASQTATVRVYPATDAAPAPAPASESASPPPAPPDAAPPSPPA